MIGKGGENIKKIRSQVCSFIIHLVTCSIAVLAPTDSILCFIFFTVPPPSGHLLAESGQSPLITQWFGLVPHACLILKLMTLAH